MRRREILASLAVLTAAVPAAALASGGEKKAEKKRGGGESYIQIPTLTATIVRSSGRRGVLTVETGIDVPDSGLRTRADLNLPRLRAAYVQVVQTYAAGLTPDTPPNPDFLARELQRQTDTVLGRKGARLLLGSILLN